jgi:hypothetical protein
MNNEHNFRVGNVVSFPCKSGKRVEGVITDFKLKTPGKNKLARMGFGHMATSHRMAVISTPGSTSFWTVPTSMLTFVQEGSNEQVQEAEKVVSNVKYAIRNRKDQRIGQRVDLIIDRNLDKFNVGDKINIRFRDRFASSHFVKECTYLGQTSSLRIRVRTYDEREISVSPNCVVV